MSSVAFFPWLVMSTEVDVGPIHLVRYQRGVRPGGSAQGVLDKLTEPYWRSKGHPIDRATIFRYGDYDLLADFPEEDVPVVFECGMLVTTAGLAARQFFRSSYWNRDNFQLTVQRFDQPDRGTFIQTRRIDGSTNTFISHDQLVVAQPVHTYGASDITLDLPFLEALLVLRTDEEWPRFREALQGFNLANTDSVEVPIETAVVLLNGSLEQIVGAQLGREADFAAKLLKMLNVSTQVDPVECERFSSDLSEKLNKYETVTERWARDLFRLRGDFAHGRMSAQYPSVWNAREHLLLASFSLPLLLKRELERKGIYELSTSDLDEINAFEALCCADHFEERSDNQRFPWHEARSRAGLDRIVEQWLSKQDPSHEQLK